MRIILALALILPGCLGVGGPERGGWSIFEGGISCRDCERLVFSTNDGGFEINETIDVCAGDRLFGWYESEIEVGTHFVIEWIARDIPEIETRRAAAGDGWSTDTHECEADPLPPQPPQPTPTVVPPSPANGPIRRCVWDHTATVRLEAPQNGITIIWEIENHGDASSVAFSARSAS